MTGDTAFPPRRRDEVEREVLIPQDAGAVDRLAKGLLETVLEQTATEPTEGTDRELLQALAPIARRHSGREFCREPILVELVQEILARQFPNPGMPAAWLPIAKQIATTLFDDPAAQRRLTRFWIRLSESVQ